MFCRRCGTQLDDRATFCGQCGTRVERDPARPKASVASESVGVSSQTRSTQESSASVAHKKTKRVSSSVKIGAVVAIVALVVIAIVAIVIVVGTMQQKSAMDAINESHMEQAIRDDSSFTQGTANTAYVDDPNKAFPTYELKSFTLDDRHADESNGTVIMTGTMVVENEFFEETAKVRAEYRRVSNEWSLTGLDVVSSDIRPLRGILWDAEHKVDTSEAGADMVFNADARTCTVTVEVDRTLWYGRMTGEQVYHYRFAGRGWEFVSVDQDVKLSDLSKLEGSYKRIIPNVHDLYGMQTIEISEVDLANLTCKVKWAWQSEITAGPTVADTQGNECICTIEPTGSDEGTLKIIIDCSRRDTSDQLSKIKNFGECHGSLIPQAEGKLRAEGKVVRNYAYSMQSRVETVFMERVEYFDDILAKK